jgi:hypothetical protein
MHPQVDSGFAVQVQSKMPDSRFRYRRAPRKFLQECVTDIAKIFYADLAGEEAVGGKLAQRGEEVDTWSESGVFLDALTIRDEVEDFYLLHATTFKIALAVAVNAGRVEPLDPAAELQLVVFVFAGQQINEFGCAGLKRPAGFIVRRNDSLAQRLQRLVLM